MCKTVFSKIAFLLLCAFIQKVELFRIRQNPTLSLATYFQDRDECMDHDYNRKSCKRAGCFFSCTDLTCNKKPDTCNDKCYDHCFDPCDCKQQGCQFNTLDQTCTLKVPECKHLDFNDPTCLKSNTFYVHKGAICVNYDEIGSCGFQPIIAVNFNGPTMTDHRGIRFVSDKEVPHSSLAHSSTNIVNLRAKVVRGAPQGDVDLYQNYITTNEEEEEECIGVKVPMSDLSHGSYEFLIKTHDPDFELPAERILKIVVNENDEEPVITALDLLSYVECDTAIDIGVKFTVYEQTKNSRTMHFYEIPGYPPKRIPSSGLSFALCRLNCEYTGQNNLPLASAMYIAKT